MGGGDLTAASGAPPMPPPVRTTASGPKQRVVGFVTDTSPSSVLHDGVSTPGTAGREVLQSPLAAAFRAAGAGSLPRLTIATSRKPGARASALKKSKSAAELRPAQAAGAPVGGASLPSTPPSRASSTGTEPVRIPRA